MNGAGTWITAVIALIVGVVIGYIYMQSQAKDLAQQVSTLQTQLTDANQKAQDAASQVKALQTDLDAKTKLVEQQQARITELEATAQQPAAPAAQ
jgi:peptidoglycan hydrolase CwlO-like protein